MTTAFALMPVTRPHRARHALRSAQRLGWNVLGMEDAQGRGPNWVRNDLLRIARSAGATVVRFLDDDDLALGITAEEALAMPGDVLSCDYLVTHPVLVRTRVRLTGNMEVDSLRWLVGNWAARVEALVSLAPDGRLWGPLAWCEASVLAHRMAKAGLRITHTPTVGYYWHKRPQGRHALPEHALAQELLATIWPAPALEATHV